MGGSFKILRVFGIDVKIHWTFFLLFVFFGGWGYLQTGNVLGGVLMTALILVLFVFVLLHEFGHALVALRQGIDVPDITLLPIGGLARLKTLPERPWDEVKIAIAGPAVNFALAALLYLPAYLLFGVSPLTLPAPELLAEGRIHSAGLILNYLGLMNIILGVFNMIPAFPMDGGRILRGLLATRFGPVRATDISSAVGQFFAFAFFVFGLLSGNFLLALIAVFIFFGAMGESQIVRQRELMRGLTVADVMGNKRRTETVTPYHNFGQVLDAVVHGYQEDFPVVEEDGRLVGMITRDEIFKAAHSSDRWLNVRDLMRTDFPTISPEADLFTEGYQLLQENNIRAVPVVEEGELVGMLTIDDIQQASLLRQLPK
ncbi:CBS domain-containing protein [Rubrobacter taiwanensis]|jgi:Zn-dependent protease/CBS domain-containing protein|uniref:Zinc metalloprotease n=1 Tax=Rubrobacter taiwanensis TaxID=185139 RepID=A0A4R1BTP0_9ACTN|nr:site-2 protease family protein [Rubrobacter taiwanensis]TCJ20656.1 CBS domain-containing protein [Rubrobacter taiwanensis]